MRNSEQISQDRQKKIRKSMAYIEEAYKKLEDLKKFTEGIYNSEFKRAGDFNFHAASEHPASGSKQMHNISFDQQLGYEVAKVLRTHLTRVYEQVIEAQSRSLGQLLYEERNKSYIDKDEGENE